MVGLVFGVLGRSRLKSSRYVPTFRTLSPRSHGITHVQDEYHLIAPDLRGFGSSTHPDDVQSSGTMYDIAGDLVCILQHANVKEAICLGHDWGAQVCYEAARIRPDVFKAVIGLVIPASHFRLFTFLVHSLTLAFSTFPPPALSCP